MMRFESVCSVKAPADCGKSCSAAASAFAAFAAIAAAILSAIPAAVFTAAIRSAIPAAILTVVSAFSSFAAFIILRIFNGRHIGPCGIVGKFKVVRNPEEMILSVALIACHYPYAVIICV